MGTNVATGSRLDVESVDDRGPIVAAAQGCVRQFGWEKTNVADVARLAGVSRATVYRRFPGGKDEIFAAVLTSMADQMLAAVAEAIASIDDPIEMVTASLHAAAVEAGRHQGLLAVARTERAVVLPLVAFDRLTPFVAAYSGDLERRMVAIGCTHRESRQLTGWVLRQLLAYLFRAADQPIFDLADRGRVNHLVNTYLAPGFRPDATCRQHQQSPT